jgi:hypothetical protein
MLLSLFVYFGLIGFLKYHLLTKLERTQKEVKSLKNVFKKWMIVLQRPEFFWQGIKWRTRGQSCPRKGSEPTFAALYQSEHGEIIRNSEAKGLKPLRWEKKDEANQVLRWSKNQTMDLGWKHSAISNTANRREHDLQLERGCMGPKLLRGQGL